MNEAIHARVMGLLPEADEFVWIVTADIKDMHVQKGRKYVPFLEILADLVERGCGRSPVSRERAGTAVS